MIQNEDLQLYFDGLYRPPVRTVKASVALYEGATLLYTFSYDGDLKSFTIERVGDSSKFFGFGVCQRLNVKVRDVDKAYSVSTANTMRVSMTIGNFEYQTICPTFKVSEVRRDEKTHELSITAYDEIVTAAKKTVADLTLPTGYDIRTFTDVAVAALGYNGWRTENVGEDDTSFDTYYPEGANFDGAETLREALNMVAEATQTIYYLDIENTLVFKRLDKEGNVPQYGVAVRTIYSQEYFNFETKTNKRLGRIFHTNELGDDVYAETEQTGSTQYIRNNAFWDMREDIGDLVNAALARMGGLCINQFSLEWRGDFLLEIGDRIKVSYLLNDYALPKGITDDIYLLDDIMEYDGGFRQKTKWDFTASELETSNNATSIGDALKMTYARVDKVNKEIEIVASDVRDNSEAIAGINIKTDEISQSVKDVENNLGSLEDEVTKNTQEIGSIKITTESITSSVESLETEIDKVSGEVAKNTEDIAAIKITTDGITSSVESLEREFDTVSGQVTKNKEDIAAIQITTDGITSSVENLEQEFDAVSGQVTKNQEDIAAIKITTDGITSSVENLEQEFDTVSGKVTKNEQDIAAIKITTESITQSVENLEQQMDGVTGEITSSKNEIASIKVTTQGIEQTVQQIESNVSGIDGRVTQNTNDIANIKLTTDEIELRVENSETTIDNLTGEVTENSQAISSIQQTTDSISSSVSNVEGKLNELTGEYESLKESIDVTMNPENLQIIIQKELENSGTGSSVITSTGYTFDEDGLTISKTGTELSTQITEDGMTVKRGDEEMLVANNEGVKATNLHATTYLIIGKYSRFEDYEPVRTGCFWIGAQEG